MTLFYNVENDEEYFFLYKGKIISRTLHNDNFDISAVYQIDISTGEFVISDTIMVHDENELILLPSNRKDLISQYVTFYNNEFREKQHE